MTLQELIDELNAIRDEYGNPEFYVWDDYHEEYVVGEIDVMVIEGKLKLFESISS